MNTEHSVASLEVGDRIWVTLDGKGYRMTVWRIDPPGSAARAESAGPWVMAWIRPGGYGIGFDDRSRIDWERDAPEQ